MRKRPYTDRGIRRKRCVRCGGPARYQWRACAVGKWMPICALCDIALNAQVLSFMNIPDRLELMTTYAARVTHEQR